MAEKLVVALGASPLALHSQSSLLLLPCLRPVSRALAPTPAPVLPRLTLTAPSPRVSFQKTVVSASAITTSAPPSSSPASTIVNDNVDFSTEGIEVGIEPDTGGGGGFEDIGSGGGGGGGGGGDGDKGPEEESAGDEEKNEGKKKKGMSMSQKLTLGYAALVGIGGLMGFLKSGSQMSLLAGGISASALFYVHTQLPSNPVLASSIGLGISAALMGVMGARFMKSGKIFPAGVVSFVSFIMTGGYIHGILRSTH